MANPFSTPTFAATLLSAALTQLAGQALVLCVTPAVALADSVDDGMNLAKQISEAEDKKVRRSLAQRVKDLGPKAKAGFVAYASKWSKDGKRVARLLPSIAEMETTSAVNLLSTLSTRVEGDEPFQVSAASQALKALLQQAPSRAVPALLQNAVSAGETVAPAHAKALIDLLANGSERDEEKKGAYAAPLRAFLDAARDQERLIQRDVEAEAEGSGARLATFRRVVPRIAAQGLVHAQQLDVFLEEASRANTTVVQLGLIQGIVDRLKRQGRPIQLIRAVEVNRRAKLSAAERENLEPIDEWHETAIRKDDRLIKLNAAIQREEQRYSRWLSSLAERAEDEAVLIAAVKLAPRFLGGELDETWAPVFFSLLESKSLQVRNLSFRLLKQVTGQKIPQARIPWEAWWKKRQAQAGGDE